MNQSEPYDTVLRELRSQRDNIDAAIKAMEKVRGFFPRIETAGVPGVGSAAPVAGVQYVDLQPAPHVGDTLRPEEGVSYAALTIYEAAIMALRDKGEAMPNMELTDAIQRGGLKMNSADNYNTVSSVLTRRFYEHGDVVRVGRGVWGLPEWYPDRDYRADAIARRDEKAEAAKAAVINSGSIVAGPIRAGIIDGSRITSVIDPSSISANALKIGLGPSRLTMSEFITKNTRS